MAEFPLVSVGLPVYNGEQYLAESIDSVLNQTFTDLELIISDNASTDDTERICREYAAKDDRVRYIRNDTNVGAAKNYNKLVDMARGKYFKWTAADDVCAPTFLEHCVEVLEHDESVILSYTLTTDIDENGEVIRQRDKRLQIDSSEPHKRFYKCICVPHPQTAVFGLIRTDILKKTRLIGAYSSSDRTLLGELALRGMFHEVPEFLFFKRHHPQAHWKVYPTRRLREAWYDPNRRGQLTFPHWRLLQEHLISIRRVSLNSMERVWCYLIMGVWMRRQWKKLAKNLVLSG